jgi:hypothetical protein
MKRLRNCETENNTRKKQKLEICFKQLPDQIIGLILDFVDSTNMSVKWKDRFGRIDGKPECIFNHAVIIDVTKATSGISLPKYCKLKLLTNVSMDKWIHLDRNINMVIDYCMDRCFDKFVVNVKKLPCSVRVNLQTTNPTSKIMDWFIKEIQKLENASVIVTDTLTDKDCLSAPRKLNKRIIYCL